jgi:hypothetical protein
MIFSKEDSIIIFVADKIADSVFCGKCFGNPSKELLSKLGN